MTSFEPDELQVFIFGVEQIVIANYCHIAATALLPHDHAITFSREVRHAWERKVNGVTVLFILNRYAALIDRILMILEIFHWEGQSPKSCDIISWLDEILLVISFLVITVFFALRVYAVYNRDWRPSFVVLLLGLVLPCAGLYQQTTFKSYVLPSPYPGCQSKSSMSLASYSILATASRAAAIASDLLVLVLTMLKTFGLYRIARANNLRTPLINLLLRDGVLYFLVIMLFNVLDIILLQVSVNGAIADLVTTLSIVLVSRLLLNLREVDLHAASGSSSSHDERSRFSTMQFSSQIMGNIGAPFDTSHDEDSEDVDGGLETRMRSIGSSSIEAGPV